MTRRPRIVRAHAVGSARWIGHSVLAVCLGGCVGTQTPVGLDGQRVASFFAGAPMGVVSGQNVALPPPKLLPAAPAEPSGDKAPREQRHKVEKGETLWRISRTYGVTVPALMEANDLADAAELRAGMWLRIPDASAPPARVQPAQPEPARAATPEPSAKPAPGPTTKPAPPARLRSEPPAAEVSPPKPEKPRPAAKGGEPALVWPVQGALTSRFGGRWGRVHDGVDIGAAAGTAVKAAAAGKVLFSEPHGSYGNLVVIKHDGGLITVYAHNQINLVRKGQSVEQGQTIARVGQTGRATAPHLHFEVRRGTAPQNPLQFLPP